jgi:CelD/BcsL family acetyltransferase involved in cellulose biosynthesis
MQINIITDISEMTALEMDWKQVDSKFPCPTQHYIWAKACMEIYSYSSSISIVLVRRDSAVVAIAPLCKTMGFLSAYEQIGVKDHNEPTDFLYQDSLVLKELISYLAKKKFPLILRRLPMHSEVLSTIRRSYRNRAIVITTASKTNPYIDLKHGSVKQLLSSRLKSDLRRARRHADCFGIIDFEVTSPSSYDDFMPLFEEAVRVEASGWKGEKGSALAFDELRKEFFKRYGLYACEQGILRMCFMRINGKAVAMQIAVESDNSFWLFKIGYDAAYAECSPGMLLIHETLCYAAERGLCSYEFLGASTPWTRRWTHNERENKIVSVYPISLQGQIIMLLDIWHHFIIRLHARAQRYFPKWL